MGLGTKVWALLLESEQDVFCFGNFMGRLKTRLFAGLGLPGRSPSPDQVPEFCELVRIKQHLYRELAWRASFCFLLSTFYFPGSCFLNSVPPSPAVCATLKTLFTEFDWHKGHRSPSSGSEAMCAFAVEL